MAQVTAYQEAKGELRFSVYLADHTARLHLKVDATALETVLQDSSIETGEREALTSEDARLILVPITDRLTISPSRNTVDTIGLGRIGRGITASPASQGFILKIRRRVSAVLQSARPTSHRFVAMQKWQNRFNSSFCHLRVVLAGVYSRLCRISLVRLI